MSPITRLAASGNGSPETPDPVSRIAGSAFPELSIAASFDRAIPLPAPLYQKVQAASSRKVRQKYFRHPSPGTGRRFAMPKVPCGKSPEADLA
jgi:hypothetical protein